MYDVIVIGGGPGGATSATLLAQRGHSVLLLEKDRFPRFQIGESLLPYNNDLFKRLGIWERLAGGNFLPKFGAEFVTADGHRKYTFRFDRNLPPEYSRSFQVSRAEFDDVLLTNAASCGVDVRQETTVTEVDLSDPDRALVTARDSSGMVSQHEARFTIDASGHGTLIGSRHSRKVESPDLKKVSFFAHFENVVPGGTGRSVGNTVIVILKNAWFWMIPVNKEITSIGLVVDRDEYKDSGLEPEELLDATIASSSYVAARMKDARRVTKIHARKDFSYRVQNLVGSNYALVGDAAGFIDPIFSTGVFMAMRSADIASEAVSAKLRSGVMRPLKVYERRMTAALKKYLMFIANFYRREFLEVFLHPSERFGLLGAVVGVLAGNVFDKTHDRWKLAIFFGLVRLQKFCSMIAPRIEWDTLPASARARSGPVPAVPEESLV